MTDKTVLTCSSVTAFPTPVALHDGKMSLIPFRVSLTVTASIVAGVVFPVYRPLPAGRVVVVVVPGIVVVVEPSVVMMVVGIVGPSLPPQPANNATVEQSEATAKTVYNSRFILPPFLL
jgi:hypothetical protein